MQKWYWIGFIVLSALIIGIAVIRNYRRNLILDKGHKITEAEIIKIKNEVKNKKRICYQYKAENEIIKSSFVQERIVPFVVGSKIKVYYSIENPKIHKLEKK